MPETESQKIEKLIARQVEGPDEKTLDEQWEAENKQINDDKDEEENDNILPNVKEYQSRQNDLTCLMPSDLTDKIEVNTSDSDKFKQQGSSNVKVAPGEGVVPTNILREEHFDVKSFPKHHPSGKYGLHYDRKCILSAKVYFNQRLLNADERFSKDSCYVFMASYYCERDSLEQKINVSGQRGKVVHDENGEATVNLVDPFDVFKSVKGSPKYWQVAQNELVAKVKQLGPFHVFYTFSCGEMRWPEVFMSVLKHKGRKVVIPPEWDGNDAELSVIDNDGELVPLWKYVNEIMSESKHELFKDYMFLITRHFDARVKSFVSNILMGHGKDKPPFEHYSYLVEFQARGMPHIHGVAWIAKSYLKKEKLTQSTTILAYGHGESQVKYSSHRYLITYLYLC